jgi:serine/threonine protein kinase
MRHRDGRFFIVMHFVSGPTLARQAGPIPLDAVVALARCLAAALAAIHAAGYVHQDISPENVILPGAKPHAAVIVDFGISLDLRSDAARRRPAVFAGKMSFASPEQMQGEPVTQASDLYSLGLVIAAAARGARLNMDRAARRKPPPLPNVPAPLAPILHRLLQPDPHNRPSVRELEDLLASLAEGKNDGHPRGRSRDFLKL